MFNIIKYDYKSQFKNLLGNLIVLVFLSLTILFYKNTLTILGAVGLTIAVSFANFIGILINGIKSYTEELYSDTGYLLFSTPSKGISIIGGKLIFSILQTLILMLITSLFMIPYYAEVKELPSLSFATIASVALLFLLGYAFFLLSTYFSASLSKMLAKEKKWGTLSGFLIFIGFWIVYGNISSLISYLIPYSANIDVLSLNSTISGSSVQISSPAVSLNIAGFIFDIIVFAALLYGTSYITEEKLDL